MKIKLTSVFVDDQEKALRFYTGSLGFIKKNDLPVGEFRWLTVVSAEGPDDIELVLEPNDNPAASAYQRALFEQGIPLAAFAVDDIQAEYKRLKELGVLFRSEPVAAGPTMMTMFEDTCGNLIQIYQE
jgi:catechol 2,3-dioxygenase-like lactoylglutathione lyase family enzyme